jgi:hypothetical protein
MGLNVVEEDIKTHAGLIITNKKMWNPELQEFFPVRLYRVKLGKGDKIYYKVVDWLTTTYGSPQQHDSSRYWNHIMGYLTMSKKVYLFYLMKWDGKL